MWPFPGAHCRKKISAKRVQINMDDCMEHASWKSYSLGLQDCDGALKKSLIDLEEPIDIDFSHVLGPLPDDDQDPFLAALPNLPNAEPTCFSRFGHCVRHVHHCFVKQFARQFATEVSNRDLPAGSLVKIIPEGHDLSEGMYFLGSFCKKPLLHVLVKAKAVPSCEHSVCLSLGGTPCSGQGLEFQTSHQVFFDLFQSTQQNGDSLPFEEISVEVLAYTFESGAFSLRQLQVQVSHTMARFKMTACKKKPGEGPKKEKISLPFGLKASARQRKPKRSLPKQGGAQPPKRRIQTSSASVPNPNLDTATAPELVSSSESSISISDSDSSDSDSLSSDSDSTGCDSNANIDANVDAGEILMPPNATARAEEELVQKEFQIYKKDVQKKQELAEQHACGASYFVKTIGFSEGSIAPTCRSVCYHCENKIKKDSPRFAYFWNVRRPSRYLHAACVVHFVTDDRDARRQQAIDAMTKVRDSVQNRSSGSSDASAVHIKQAAEDILSQLM